MRASRAPVRRLRWPEILDAAAEIVASYDTGVTLRQLFYRLVAGRLLPNTPTGYKTLSARTAAARRQDRFPALIDRTRTIHRLQWFESPTQALTLLACNYRRDRTEGQPVSLYLGVEKTGLVEQLRGWFDTRGIPILALAGYASQTYVDEIAADVRRQDREAILIYAGDFDPSGEDIERDFLARAGCFGEIVRVALTAEQVREHDLPPLPGKERDSRAAAFAERYGRLVQVELDALPPDVLRDLYVAAIERVWDESAFAAVLERERHEREELLR